MPSSPGSLTSLRLVFALNALGLSVWFPRIPDVKQALDLDVLELAFALFGMPAGTMLGFLIVERITDGLGVRKTCVWGGSIFFLSFIGPALATGPVTLGLALFVCGLTIASIEVAMNAKASQTETELGRRMMTGCHAWWSFGTVTGALVAGAFAQAGIGFLTQQIILQPIFAVLNVWFALRMIDDVALDRSTPKEKFRMPEGALLVLCMVPIGALLIEGAMLEWSALFLRENLELDPFTTSATFSAFALSMGIVRLLGDPLAERFGPHGVILGSAALMGVGILMFGGSGSIYMAAPAAAMVGLGCGNIYPLTMSIVGRLPGTKPARNVATLALIAFTAFLIGPPLIGVAAKLFGLPMALMILSPFGVVPFLLLRRQGRH